ncbi:PAS domain-containing protein [Leptospira stimsonii]|nr:PAS domain-containing protein [Leptospira stimsonii]
MGTESMIQRLQEQAAFWAKSMIRFVEDETVSKIDGLSRAEIDSLPYGVIQVDDQGKILIFNRFESEKANVPVKEAEGKTFFTQVAPCTNNAIFWGSFEKGVKQGEMDLIFPYTFTYKMRPTPVVVHLYKSKASKKNWIFVKWK